MFGSRNMRQQSVLERNGGKSPRAEAVPGKPTGKIIGGRGTGY
ncbi:hypothetical protein SpAn4DRAFT_2482 [Sporomusa ovata]|uniref:Uncharacterized protein n=1 Tax=Sporomusa ovata TaxID=2378 RepID=A0A0U1L0P6_9FIRM|nr:hypothetical protein SpAn4DRAFT_2482 [Sporomusa ovata]